MCREHELSRWPLRNIPRTKKTARKTEQGHPLDYSRLLDDNRLLNYSSLLDDSSLVASALTTHKHPPKEENQGKPTPERKPMHEVNSYSSGRVNSVN